jgi:hypothetical protein
MENLIHCSLCPEDSRMTPFAQIALAWRYTLARNRIAPLLHSRLINATATVIQRDREPLPLAWVSWAELLTGYTDRHFPPARQGHTLGLGSTAVSRRTNLDRSDDKTWREILFALGSKLAALSPSSAFGHARRQGWPGFHNSLGACLQLAPQANARDEFIVDWHHLNYVGNLNVFCLREDQPGMTK